MVNHLQGSATDPTPTRKALLNTLFYTALFNTAIAGLLATAGFGQSLGTTWVFSQCVGLSICICVVTAMRISQDSVRTVQALALVLAISLGAITGTGLGSLFTQLANSDAPGDGDFLLRVVGISILFGLIITYFFHSRQQLATST